VESLYVGRETEQSEVAMFKELCTITSVSKKWGRDPESVRKRGGPCGGFGLMRGLLALMTTLIYMITTGTRISGLQKRYKTALEAGLGGADIFYQVIALRGQIADISSFTATLNSYGLNVVINDPRHVRAQTAGQYILEFVQKL
jgi:hypothetical protein